MNGTDGKSTLLRRLQTAFELELATIPAYMVALLSMKLAANRYAANLIRSVLLEEMLHVALVANVMNAVGGSLRIGPKTIPSYPLWMNFEGQGFADRDFPVNLAAFSPGNVETFRKIEEPRARPPDARSRYQQHGLPIEGLTIGLFYDHVIWLLEVLTAILGTAALFNGDPSRQLHDDYYWGGSAKLFAVSNLDSARAALETIILQGEGAWPPRRGSMTFDPPRQMGHYYRFSEIHYQRLYTAGDDPAEPPTGEPLPIDYSAIYPITTNPTASLYPPGSALARLNDAFNTCYTMTLRQLAEAFAGAPKTLYTAIGNGMQDMTSIAQRMMETPIEGDPEGRTGCPTFDWV
jgi:hypothetical protein